MSSIIDKWSKLLRKKKTITVIILIVVGFITMNIFKAIYRPTIREQQVASVAKASYTNKQFKAINEKEITQLLANKGQQVIAFIDPSDNKGYDKLEKMFNQKTPLETMPATVYVYEPVYPDPKLIKDWQLNEKNTFLVLNDGKEAGRYSFNDLSVGYEEIGTELNAIINPKIPRKQPVRKETKLEEDQSESTLSTGNGETHTSEIFFE